MSGGAFDYNSLRIRYFAEELKDRIENNKSEFNPVVMKTLVELQKSIEMAAEFAHHIEWLYSGDHGEESFLELVNETANKEEYQ